MTTAPENLQPRFHINKKHWKEFKSYIDEVYPLDHFTQDQKEFVHKYLKQDGGKCSDLNFMWINCVADQLVDFAGILPSSHEGIGDQLERLQAITGKAVLGLYNAQHALRLSVPFSVRTAEQHRMLEIRANIFNYPAELTVDIGRLLHVTDVTGMHEAVDPEHKAEEQQLFHQLHTILQKATRGRGEESQSETASIRSATEELAGDFHAHSAEDTFLRLCCYKVWSEKYEQENEWSVSQMLGPWLQEAIQLYNHVSYHWPQCHVKKFDQSQLSIIRRTAKGWIEAIAERAPVTSRVKKPTSNWLMDWCTYPVTEKRHMWDAYFCNVLLHAKNLAKLMGKRTRSVSEEADIELEHGEQDQTTGAKRLKSGDAGTSQPMETSGGEPSELRDLETRLVAFITSECSNLRRNMVQIDRNASIRHQETMRELLGHFNPIRNQLLQISAGQSHVSSVVDRIITK